MLILKRAVFTSWGVFIGGSGLLLVFPRHLVRSWTVFPLLVIGLLLIPASAIFILNLGWNRAVSQFEGGRAWAATKVQKVLVVCWILVLLTLFFALLFPRQAPSPEVLLVLVAIVGLSSMAYVATIIVQRLIEKLK